MEKVCVIGLGYIGLPTASLLATKGFNVHGVDIDPKVIKTINKGEIHIYEPDLDILVKSAVHSGNLKASLEPNNSDVFIIAVPTPFKDNHIPDLSYVESATKAIIPHLKPGNLVILESTCPVGTTEKIGKWIEASRPELSANNNNESLMNGSKKGPIFLAHCPERVLPGQILKELVENDRIIGGITPTSSEMAQTFYKKFINAQTFLTNARTAELAKLTENAFRDVNIAFANELSLICDQLDINVYELIELANKHPRVKILQPGPGVGGHCIAVDPWFIIDSAPEQTRLIRMAREVNDGKPSFIIKKVKQKAARLKEPVIACLGLSFKENIDDLRESPAMFIVERLAEEIHGKLLVVEPHVEQLPKPLIALKNIEKTSLQKALIHSDILVLLVNHNAFADIDRELLKEKIVIDTRGMWR